MKKLIAMCLMFVAFGALGALSACSDARDDIELAGTLSDQIDEGALPPDTAVPVVPEDEDDGKPEALPPASSVATIRDTSLVRVQAIHMGDTQFEAVSNSVVEVTEVIEKKMRSDKIVKLTEMIDEYVAAFAKTLDESTGEAHDKIADMSDSVDAVKQRAGVALMFAIGYAASGDTEKFDEVFARAQDETEMLRDYAVVAIELAK
jgi:hypothetical protein